MTASGPKTIEERHAPMIAAQNGKHATHSIPFNDNSSKDFVSFMFRRATALKTFAAATTNMSRGSCIKNA